MYRQPRGYWGLPPGNVCASVRCLGVAPLDQQFPPIAFQIEAAGHCRIHLAPCRPQLPQCKVPELIRRHRPVSIQVLGRIQGAYALGIVCADCPDRIIAARKDSPLILGLGKDFHFLASDVTAVIKYTRDVYYLDDGEIAELTADDLWVYDAYLRPVQKEQHHVDWEISAAEKGGYEHFMAKEIME